MPKVKTLKGDQLPLPLAYLKLREMTAMKPATIRFLLSHQGENVPWMGVAIAQNSSCQRVRGNAFAFVCWSLDPIFL